MKDAKEVISDTCLSISDISDKTVKELKQEIERIKNDYRLNSLAKNVLIREAEVGIERFESIKKKVKDYCILQETENKDRKYRKTFEKSW